MLFRQEIYRKGLLEQSVAFVLFIFQNAQNSRLGPFLFLRRGEDSLAFQKPADSYRGHPIEETAINQPHDFRFVFIDDRIPVLAAMYAYGFSILEESDKGYNMPAYDTATRQYTVQWTWVLYEEKSYAADD